MQPNSPRLPSTSSLDSYFVYSSPPNENQVRTNAIQNNLPFDLYSGLPFLPNDSNLATQVSYPLLYHHPNQYPHLNEDSFSMDLHRRVDPTSTWLTTSSSGPSTSEGNRWESISSSDSSYGDPNYLDDTTFCMCFFSRHQMSRLTIVSVPQFQFQSIFLTDLADANHQIQFRHIRTDRLRVF